MRDVLLIAPNAYTFDTMKGLLPAGMEVVQPENEDRIYLRNQGFAVSVEVNHSPEVVNIYQEPWQRAVVGQVGAEPRFYFVVFWSMADLRDVLSAIADTPDLFVDNDNGIVERGDQFVARWRRDRSWGW
ncbi:hypothetical protein [Tahibacter amnicola]|uniref:Uncharacterized protein n=1 Tax=Tahibacter amnicola TaxID=2976241 RepID=A0ABY6BF97_9GAMM|nr:hypothetical protein [Tahibacter amnicola]UXI68549.1 hypothetical protein N4264_02530 [Tahibacter amnicola]